MLKRTYGRNKKSCRLQLQALEDRDLMATLADLGSVVEYDRATGSERIIAASPEFDSLVQEMRVAGYDPSSDGQSGGRTDFSVPETLPGRTIFGADDRTQITPTTTYPWRSMGALYADQYAPRPCSGVMVSSFHFLTAAHCVNPGGGGNWYSGIKVAPGQDGANRWFGEASWNTMRAYTNWTVGSDWNWDFALITLDRPVGNWTGWLGREWYANDATYNGMNLNTAGYPADKPQATMWYAYGASDFATTNRVFFNDTLDVVGGQSGSPMYRYDGTNRYVNVVITHEQSDYNSGTRMTQGKFNDLNAWMGADVAPPALADLVDYDKWFSTTFNSFSPNKVNPGDDFFIQPFIQNNGFATGGYWVDFFASTDNNITTSDNLIGYVWVSSTGSYTWVGAGDTNTFPTIPAGNYYVGWVIDTFNNVAEYNEFNNTAVITNNLLAVLPAAPSSLTASPVSNSQIDLSWSEVAGEYGYLIERSPDGASWTQVGSTDGNVTHFSDVGLSSGTAHYYRVRAYTGDLGKYSPTSGAVTFVDAPASLTAVGGTQKITLNWSDVYGEFGYEIERSLTGVGDWTQLGSVSSDTTSYVDSGLAPGTTYYYRVRGYNVSGYGEFSTVTGDTTTKFTSGGSSSEDAPPPVLGNPPPLPAPPAPLDQGTIAPAKPSPATAARRMLVRAVTPDAVDVLADVLP